MSLASGAPNPSATGSSPDALEVNSASEDVRELLKLLLDTKSPLDLIVGEMHRVNNINPDFLSQYVVPYSGMTLIFYAVQRLSRSVGDIATMEGDSKSLLDLFITKFGANPDSLDGVMKQTPLFYAAKAGSVAICSALVSTYKGNGSPIDVHNQTPLYYAAREGQSETVEWLVRSGGCNVNHVDKNGQTALFYAARENKIDCVRKMIEELGCDPLIRDVYKKRVRAYLKPTAQKECYDYLTEVEKARDPSVSQHAHRKLFLVKPGEPVGAAAMTLRQHKPYNPYEHEEVIMAAPQSLPAPPPKRQRSGASTPANSVSRESTGPRERLSLATPPPATPVTVPAGRNRYRVKAPLGKGGLEEFEKKFPDLALWNKGKEAAGSLDGTSPPPKPAVSRAPRAPIASLTPPWVSVVSQLLRGPLWRYGPATIFHKPVFQLPPNLGPKYLPDPGAPEMKLSIDLSLIRKKLEKGKYLRLTEVDRDVRSMFEQGLVLANGPESPLGLLTKATEVYYDQQLAGSGLAAVLRQEATDLLHASAPRPDEQMVTHDVTKEI